ncbi:ubiquitin/ISG15-conjugating enzyme E2 L6 isoform X3 [Pogoniulus pusillus]|uniref:ubiquitin/ISG15-conjugating enzyme E2 L6 isoform X3 n=1 Tax=Pogoniulus pusillus TaxID=488313 RepID=UPI0030B95221
MAARIAQAGGDRPGCDPLSSHRRSCKRRGAGAGSMTCGRWTGTCCGGGGCCCRIYHPGVDTTGRVCQPLTSAQHWVATTRAIQVLQDLLLLLDNPDTERVLRQDLSHELHQQPDVFWHRAEEHTRCHAEPRPDTPASS